MDLKTDRPSIVQGDLTHDVHRLSRRHDDWTGIYRFVTNTTLAAFGNPEYSRRATAGIFHASYDDPVFAGRQRSEIGLRTLEG